MMQFPISASGVVGLAHHTDNVGVDGSSPSWPTKFTNLFVILKNSLYIYNIESKNPIKGETIGG